jgi:hypothetical protein
MEARLFPEGTVPDYTKAEWYADRERAPHIDEALHRPRLELTATMCRLTGRATLSDLGAGDGGLLWLLRDDPIVAWGYDLQQSNVDGAMERGVHVRLGDVIDGPIDYGEISVATEMIEHLLDPHAFVAQVLQHSEVMIASSPWTETAESHYGYHTWAWDQAGYRAMFEGAGWRVEMHQATGMFQVLMAVRP